ncbi:MAG TPA: dihydrofolate reductase family protein [Afifellaceae bacterium]|nr:dihydrofolate reductase family protein [Afifellaceae bacterium]
MSKLRVECISVSLDGFSAGPGQDLDNPMGIGGMAVHEWFFPTRTFQKNVLGQEGGKTGTDDEFAAHSFENIGAWIMGRNMFGPVRGAWPDDDWKGWWGENPPFHTDVFVLTHHERPPLEMEGGTIFHFVTVGIHAALDRARDAAGNKDVRVSGGAATIRQYLQAGLVDRMHIAVAPAVLGAGEQLLGGIDLPACGLDQVEYVPTAAAAHYVLSKE